MTQGKSHCALTYQQRSKAITELNRVQEDPIKKNPRKFDEIDKREQFTEDEKWKEFKKIWGTILIV